MRFGIPILFCALLVFTACEKLKPTGAKQVQAQRDDARDRRVRQACASQASYERLKALAFEKAAQVREGSSPMLAQLAAATVVRMENPVVKSRDEALNVTVCTGRIVIELPPGAEDAFDGDRQLTAEVEYAAQSAADGSGLVYQLGGADPIIYRLAAIDLKNASLAEAAKTADAPPPEPPAAIVAAAAAASPRPQQKAPDPRIARAAEAPRPPVARPSFDCRYARTRTEQMVCSDERLAAYDRDMAAFYNQAIAASDPETRAILRRSRDPFLFRRERCDSPGCVAAVYEDRIDEIDWIASGE